MKILVLGGTLFFGKILVSKLIESGDDVTIATRGKTEDPFANGVKRIVVDRFNARDMKLKLKDSSWNIVYDQICYSPDDASTICRIFENKIDRLIFTSTQAVYDYGCSLKETNFDPFSYPLKSGDRKAFSYREGKRFAEVVYVTNASFPVTMVRLPFVLGKNDYTKRLSFHIRRIMNEQPVYFPDFQAKISLISSDNAAEFLSWLKENRIDGPINACCPDPVSLKDLVDKIEKVCGKRIKLTNIESEETHSPYGFPRDWYMDSSKASDKEFSFRKTQDWLPDLIKYRYEEIQDSTS